VNRVGHRLQAGVRTQLSIDVVEMIAESLGGNGEVLRDADGLLPVGQRLENPALLLRERRDRHQSVETFSLSYSFVGHTRFGAVEWRPGEVTAR